MTEVEAEQIVKRLEAIEQKLQALEKALLSDSKPVELSTTTPDGRPIISTDHPLIVRIEGVRGGEPITRYSSISVRVIIGWIRLGETPEQIRQAYEPYLSLAEICDALSYYVQHQSEIDQYIAENNAALERAIELSHLAAERKRLRPSHE
jgi:uncharacterized protein (DUF433 family)